MLYLAGNKPHKGYISEHTSLLQMRRGWLVLDVHMYIAFLVLEHKAVVTFRLNDWFLGKKCWASTVFRSVVTYWWYYQQCQLMEYKNSITDSPKLSMTETVVKSESDTSSELVSCGNVTPIIAPPLIVRETQHPRSTGFFSIHADGLIVIMGARINRGRWAPPSEML